MDGIAIICQKLLMGSGGAELVSVGEIRPDARWRMPPHRHPLHHEMIVLLGGSMRLKTSGIEVTATKGDILFYRQGMTHEEISRPSDPVQTLYLAFRSRKPLAGPLQTLDSDGRIRQMASWLQQDFQRDQGRMSCQALLGAILSEWARLARRRPDPWVAALLDDMKKCFTEKITLPDLARRAGMSRFAFVRKFKRLSGHTPMEQLRIIRLTEARNMILGSGLPLKVVAVASGLGDEYQLSKLFRRYFGVSPREFRIRGPGLRG